MASVVYLGYHAESGRSVYLLELETLQTPIEVGPLGGHQFTCFCAIDAERQSADALGFLCAALLRLGCAYFCVWGRDCGRVHDVMDEEVIGANPPRTDWGSVMTTWHADESLEESLDFFLTSTSPSEDYAPNGCDTALIVSVASDVWPEGIRRFVQARSTRDSK